jgi:hypothetical protein
MLFSPTIEAAITASYWFLRARCTACRTTGDVDLRNLDWHRGAAVTALIPALSCRSCRPNAPFAELVCLSKASLAEEYYAERSGNRWIRSDGGKRFDRILHRTLSSGKQPLPVASCTTSGTGNYQLLY